MSRSDEDQRKPLLQHNASGASLDELEPQGRSVGLPEPATNDSPRDTDSMAKTIKEHNAQGGTALGVQILGLVFLIMIWTLALRKLPLNSPFVYHPLLQSLSLTLLLQSVLVLQPTVQSKPGQKTAARRLHQYLNVLIVILFTSGAAIMFYLHHPNSHWISWHGIMGSTVVVWMWVQALVGAATVLFNGALVGGQNNGKALWKWHRLSGYILLPIVLLTLFTGATQTSWSQQNSGKAYHTVIGVVLLAIGVLGAARVQSSKLPQVW